MASVDLTVRQLQVLELLAEGLVYKEIAARLGITVSTVRSHTNHLYRRLGVYNGAAAIAKVTQLEIRVKAPPTPVARRPANGLADTHPLLHAYLKLWENAGSPVPRLVDLGHDVPDRQRKAMRILLAMHLTLDEPRAQGD